MNEGTLKKWHLEVIELSNNVFRLTMTHETGIKFEKTGVDLDSLNEDAKEYALKIEHELVENKTNHNSKHKI